MACGRSGEHAALPGAAMRLALWVCALAFASSAVAVQSRDPLTLYWPKRGFRIPFNATEDAKSRLREVQLWASTDRGQTWGSGPVDRAGGDRGYFVFRAPDDGEYWFAVRSVGADGLVSPLRDAAVEAGMKVIVDTAAPTLIVEPRDRRGSIASIHWESKDEHLNVKKLVIEYQVEGVREWRRVPLKSLTESGEATWDAGTAEPIRVRAEVADLAGNIQRVEVRLPDGSSADPVGAGPAQGDENPPPISESPAGGSLLDETASAESHPVDAIGSGSGSGSGSGAMHAVSERREVEPEGPTSEAAGPTPEEPQRAAPIARGPGAGRALRVASSHISLKYDVEGAGPGGPAVVELWVTRDNGRNWSRLDEDADRTSPYEVDLGGEGTFGLTLVVRSENGLGDQPPAPGDPPQMWVEVDSRPPTVTLDAPHASVASASGSAKVVITWRAEDEHLAGKCVQLLYRTEDRGAAWKPITQERLENSGRYVWTVPVRVPDRFHIRVDVYDRMGNRGSADTTSQGVVVLDRARPHGRLIGLDPGPGGADSRPRR